MAFCRGRRIIPKFQKFSGVLKCGIRDAFVMHLGRNLVSWGSDGFQSDFGTNASEVSRLQLMDNLEWSSFKRTHAEGEGEGEGADI